MTTCPLKETDERSILQSLKYISMEGSNLVKIPHNNSTLDSIFTSLLTMKINLKLNVDFRGALGLGSFPPLKDFQFNVQVKSTASDEEVQKIKQLTDERCPAIWAMQNPVPFTTIATKLD